MRKAKYTKPKVRNIVLDPSSAVLAVCSSINPVWMVMYTRCIMTGGGSTARCWDGVRGVGTDEMGGPFSTNVSPS